MLTQSLISAWNFSLFMHHSKFVNHSGTPALWHSVLKLKQVTRFAVGLSCTPSRSASIHLMFGKHSICSRTGDRLGLFRVLAQGCYFPQVLSSRNPRGKDIVPECHGSTLSKCKIVSAGLGAAETVTSQQPSADRHLIYL
jgi:hypothetical protein